LAGDDATALEYLRATLALFKQAGVTEGFLTAAEIVKAIP